MLIRKASLIYTEHRSFINETLINIFSYESVLTYQLNTFIYEFACVIYLLSAKQLEKISQLQNTGANK